MPTSCEPTSITQALKDPQWLAAMTIEYRALISNNTWDLVPPSPNQNLVGSKWVRVKRKPDGSIDRFKARLVAKGFHQRPGIDFHETFSPVIKPTIVQLVICLALAYGWSLWQLDINNTFLHGHLQEEVFMKQPSGFVDSNKPNFLCRLNKSIYGLKQAPCAWFTALHYFLLAYGFHQCRSDASLFIYNTNGVRV